MADATGFAAEDVRRMAEASGDDVSLGPLPLAGIVALRARGGATARAAQALGLSALPSPNTVAATPLGDCLWVRPDEWHVVGDHAARRETLARLEAAVGDEEGGVVDISSSRVLLELTGARARDVLASCCPLDLHPRAFAVGRCAQSMAGKAPILLQLTDAAPRWRLFVRPSLSAYVVSWLTDAMHSG